METVQLTFRLLAASQVIFLGLYVVINHRSRIGQLVAANAAGLTAYLIAPLSETWFYTAPTHLLIILFANLVPATIWLLGRHIFLDNKAVPLWFWPLLSVYLILWLPDWSDQTFISNSDLESLLLSLVPQTMKLGFALHVIVMALSHREADLIQARYLLRVPIALLAAGICSIVILVEIWAGSRHLLLVDAVWSVVIFTIAVITNLKFFQLRHSFMLPKVEPNSETPPLEQAPPTTTKHKPLNEDIHAQLVDQISQRFYAQHGVTLTDLANNMGVPAHKLRPVINDHMRFQNFNQFLNHHRIAEASQQLLDRTELPILTIALDVGFRSLSTFNKAFKETHHQTPSEYRNTQSPKLMKSE